MEMLETSVIADQFQGLSEAEVQDRRSRGLGNNLKFKSSRSYAQILRDNLFTFINCVLFAIGLTLSFLGRVSDALVSVGVVFFNMVVSLAQEIRAKRKLDRITLLTRPRVTVIREGHERILDPAEIVIGDLGVVRPGDQVVADGQVVSEGQAELDESLLTGESDSVLKTKGDQVFSGSFCVNGSAVYEVQKVGEASFANQITAGARAYRQIYTPLQREVNLVVRVLVLLAIFYGILLALASILNNTTLVESAQAAAVIAGLVPNGLFMAITLAYALGAVRIANKGALVQQANAVESLSNVDVLCTDKTGTLTANRIGLYAVKPLIDSVSEEALRSILGSYARSTLTPNRTIQALAQGCPNGWIQFTEAQIPFSSERKWSALYFGESKRAEDLRDADPTVLRRGYVLGAPEVLELRIELSEAARRQIEEWTAQGLRVLLLAHFGEPCAWQDAAGEPCLPPQLSGLGLIALSDELRDGVHETLRAFSRVGVAFKIISGDHPQTVAALARQAGLDGDELKTITGSQLEELSESELAQVAEETTIFGRITPRQKEKLVQALRKRGHYVAMTGDGVNDVLSLKQANLGIAMESGSPATRSVADIILLGDSFAALPPAFGEGRRIRSAMTNIMKLFMVRVFFSAMLMMAVAAIDLGFPFTPKQSSILVLLTVGIPVIGLTVWARPEATSGRSLVRSLLHFAIPATLLLTLLGLGVYAGFLVGSSLSLKNTSPQLSEAAILDQAEPVARAALTTVTIYCGLLLVVFAQPPTQFWVGGQPKVNGDWRPALLALADLMIYWVIVAIAPLRNFFDLAPLPILDNLLLVGLALLWGLGLRWLWRYRLLDKFLNTDLN